MQVAAGQIGGPPAPGNQVFQFTINALGRLSDTKEFENIIVKSEAPRDSRHRRANHRRRASLVASEDQTTSAGSN